MNSIQNLGLKAILLVLGKIAGLEPLHRASRPLMYYAVECMRPTIYYWSTSLLGNMKQRLIDCKLGRVRNFVFTSILTTFFFECILRLIPRVEITPHDAQDPSQLHWANVMQRLGGGRVANPYPAYFFLWWHRWIISIDDYPYEGINFRGDLDIPIPPGSAYEDRGNNPDSILFLNYLIFCVFLYSDIKRHVFV